MPVKKTSGNTGWKRNYTMAQLLAYASDEEELQPGDVISAGTIGFSCSVDTGKWPKPGDVFERDLHLVRVGGAAEVVTAAYPDRRFRAQVARISDAVDPATHTLKVRFVTAEPSIGDADSVIRPASSS